MPPATLTLELAEFDRDDEPPYRLDKVTGLKRLTRYHHLVATLNGTPKSDLDLDRAASIREWTAAALR